MSVEVRPASLQDGVAVLSLLEEVGYYPEPVSFAQTFRRTITNPVQPDPGDPTRLVPYTGPALTVGGELNKLGMNFAMGRNWTGIHWWSDAAASMAIGEEVAIALLRDERMAIREPFEGFSLTRFDGRRATI